MTSHSAGRITVRKLATTLRLSDEEILVAVADMEVQVLHRAPTRTAAESPLDYLARVKTDVNVALRDAGARIDQALSIHSQ